MTNFKKLAFLLSAGVAFSSTATFANIAAQSGDDTIVVSNGRVDTAVFGKRPFMRQPRLSPDGTKLAVMMSRDGTDNLGWLDLNKPNGKPNFFVQAEEFRDAGDRNVLAWRWVGNKTIVITLASREIINGQRGDLRRLAAYDIVTGKMTPIAWENAGADASDILFIDDEKETILVQRDTIKDIDYK